MARRSFTEEQLAPLRAAKTQAAEESKERQQSALLLSLGVALETLMPGSGIGAAQIAKSDALEQLTASIKGLLGSAPAAQRAGIASGGVKALKALEKTPQRALDPIEGLEAFFKEGSGRKGTFFPASKKVELNLDNPDVQRTLFHELTHARGRVPLPGEEAVSGAITKRALELRGLARSPKEARLIAGRADPEELLARSTATALGKKKEVTGEFFDEVFTQISGKIEKLLAESPSNVEFLKKIGGLEF